MTIEKFPHLDNINPEIKSILNTPVEQVSKTHLGQLKEHFKWIKEKFGSNENSDIALAAEQISLKIENIIALGKKEFSGEIIAATADDYNSKYKKAA